MHNQQRAFAVKNHLTWKKSKSTNHTTRVVKVVSNAWQSSVSWVICIQCIFIFYCGNNGLMRSLLTSQQFQNNINKPTLLVLLATVRNVNHIHVKRTEICSDMWNDPNSKRNRLRCYIIKKHKHLCQIYNNKTTLP